MLRIAFKQLQSATPYNETSNLLWWKSLFTYNIRYRESLSEKTNAKNESTINIDRPQTDDLLISPETLRKQGTSNTTQDIPKSYQLKEINTQEIKNFDSLTKANEEQLKDSLVWTPKEQEVALTTTSKLEHAIEFENVPGPTSLKVISNLMKYLPVIGKYTMFSKNIKPYNMLFDKYGDVVCLRVPFCGDIVLVQKPEHISEIYKQRNLESMTFSSFDSLTEWHKRQTKRHLKDINDMMWDSYTWYEYPNYFDYKDIVLDDRFEQIFSKSGLNLTQELRELFKENYEAKSLFWSNSKYHNAIEKTSDDFLKRIYSIKSIHDEVPDNFQKELNVWGIECMMQTLFGTGIGFYQVNDLETNDSSTLLDAFVEASEALQKCESGLQLWRIYNTRSWERLSYSCETMENILAKHIRMSKLRLDIALKVMNDKKDVNESAQIIKSSLVKALILSGCVQPEQILTLCLDMMLIGVNAASVSLGFIFYHLSKSPRTQHKLFNEISRVLPEKNSVLQLDSLRDTPYLHACVTESLRLKHPIPYSTMCLPKTIVINKYCIPAGTYVMTANEISCLKEDHFDEATKFKPERWLDNANGSLQDAVVPLNEGTRMFLGRDWLHQQIAVATAKVVRNFVLGYNYGEINTTQKMLSQPTKPFKFTFIERSS